MASFGSATAARRVQQLANQLNAGSASADARGSIAPLDAWVGQERSTAPAPLEEERKKASFNPRLLTYYLDGGEQWTATKERMMQEFERDPAYSNEDRHDWSRPEVRERTMRKIGNMLPFLLNESEAQSRVRFDLLSLIDPGLMTRMGVHYGLFFGAIRGQATMEQMSELLEQGLLNLRGMYGCFAMTELGHGSNVAGLETTATFDRSSDEFIIHTPTVTATKWWIGGAAQSATHSVVFAQLIVDGKNYGVKSFLVQLRDPKSFALKPGVNIGDCGAKMFTNVRIPRTNMLMKHTQVKMDGTVVEPPMAQLTYGALIGGRVQMVMDSANVSKLAVTIAIRYGFVRRQFSQGDGPEKQIINYATHQYRLMPLLALTYAMHFGGMQTNKIYMECVDKLESADPGDDMKDLLEMLKSTHATSAGLKAFCTWNCLDLIEQCRQALGGHGYSAYAGLAALYQDFAVQCSWEGDNTIMMLQTGRYLVNCYRDIRAGARVPSSSDYLGRLEQLRTRRSTATTKEQLIDLNALVETYDVICAHLITATGQMFDGFVANGTSTEQAYEECAVHMVTAARAHCYNYLLHRFVDAIGNADAILRPVLSKVAILFALYFLQERIGTFALQYGYLSSHQFEMVRREVFEYCKAVRADAVPLVDAFNLSDFVIGSPMGRYDGDIYTHYFEKVRRAPNAFGIPPYFETVTKKLFEREPDMP